MDPAAMNDPECVQFLQRNLPRLRMRWAGFRKVRRQVCRRITRRMHELGLADTAAYQAYLESNPGEWARLDGLCRVTISRFYRDRAVGDFLRDEALPTLAHLARQRGDEALRVWSVGCASGEEPYTLSLLWRLCVGRRFPGLGLTVLATDSDEALIERARAARYPASSLRDLPEQLRRQAFEPEGDTFRLRAECRLDVEFRRSDVRDRRPEGPFHLVLCRNLVFTYFDETLQRELLDYLAETVLTGGGLVVGTRERLPGGQAGLAPWRPELGVHRRER